MEFGARGGPWPTEEKAIRPYAADDYPDFFEPRLHRHRTVCEAHRPKESPTPQYFSRHYYDIAMLLDTAEGKAAATDFELLGQVARHKAVFFDQVGELRRRSGRGRCS
ncbi:nucleotidyl transferase AbiEii/AbiGii toxin family protein [Bradyrhizobium sp. USDA 10063]